MSSRARTGAIRERMERTGEPYVLAARLHDEERAAEREAAARDAAETVEEGQ